MVLLKKMKELSINQSEEMKKTERRWPVMLQMLKML